MVKKWAYESQIWESRENNNIAKSIINAQTVGKEVLSDEWNEPCAAVQ